MRKVDNPECKVISLIVDADTERCAKIEGVKAFQCYGSKRKDYSRMQNHDENQQRK